MALVPFISPSLIDFHRQMNNELQSTPSSSGNHFTDDTWRITSGTTGSDRLLSFEPFKALHTYFPPIDIVFNGETIAISVEDLAKTLIVRVCSRINNHQWEKVRYGLLCIFTFLKTNNVNAIHRKDLENFFETTLSNRPLNGSWTPLITPCRADDLISMRLEYISLQLRRLAVDDIVHTLNQPSIFTALNSVCEGVLGQTLNDYREGGSRNTLGLDVGQYYLHHCASQFVKFYPYVYALTRTQKYASDAYKKAINPKASKNTINQFNNFLNHLMRGGNPSEHPFAKHRPDQGTLTSTLIYKTFRDSYEHAPQIRHAVNLDTISRICNAAQLPKSRIDSEEFIRSYLLSSLEVARSKSKQQIFKEYAKALQADGSIYHLNHEQFEQLLWDNVISAEEPLPELDSELQDYLVNALEYLSDLEHPALFSSASELLDASSTAKMSALQTVRDVVLSFGMCLFVGLTGWRRSEYGFSANSMSVTTNNDPLDNCYTPFRFHVRWKVPKTSKNLLVDREITSHTYAIAQMLGIVNGSLGSSKLLMNTHEDSLRAETRAVDKAVKLPWFHFLQKYHLFSELDEIDRVRRNPTPTQRETDWIRGVDESFFWITQESEIREFRDKLRAELPIWRLLNATNPTIGDHISAYKHGRAANWATDALDRYLSPEDKDLLHASELDLDTVLYLRNALAVDLKYPTPHGLRHIWAEAVLRRYSGDVGRIIRSNFKHLDYGFFMAYLKKKDMRLIYETASRTVISSIVRKVFVSHGAPHRGYAGLFDRFVSKAITQTKVRTGEGLIALANKVATESIIDITPHPWATCMPRQGTERSSACSRGGELQRQDASPELCIDCINGHMDTAHINAVIIYTADHLKVLRSDIPTQFKEPSLVAVKSAMKRVAEIVENAGDTHKDFATMSMYLRDLQAAVEAVESEMEAVE